MKFNKLEINLPGSIGFNNTYKNAKDLEKDRDDHFTETKEIQYKCPNHLDTRVAIVNSNFHDVKLVQKYVYRKIRKLFNPVM